MEHRERELKFDVPGDWSLPDLAEAVPHTTARTDTVHLESTYFDTDHLDLLRAGVSLRWRRGGAAGTDTGWQLKVPAGIARTEITLPLDDEHTVPAQLLDATYGARGGRELRQVAVLRTERFRHHVVARDGRELVEVAVDEVTATATGESASRWREVEAEIVDGSESDLQRVAEQLTRAGATPAGSASKVARALGKTPPRRDPTTAAGLVAQYLDTQTRALVAGDVALRRGGDAVHKTRVAARRYRSVVRVFGSLFDGAERRRLDDELAWYAAALGEVRDRQVLRKHLDAELAALAPELVGGDVARRVHAVLDAEQAAATAALGELMATDRYLTLLADLQNAVPVGPGEARTLKKYVNKARRKVRKRIEAVPAGEGRDEALHRLRKAAKRARYAAELAEPALGKPARRLAKQFKKLQTVLGDRQDQVVAAAFLRRVAPADASFTLGVLYERNA